MPLCYACSLSLSLSRASIASLLGNRRTLWRFWIQIWPSMASEFFLIWNFYVRNWQRVICLSYSRLACKWDSSYRKSRAIMSTTLKSAELAIKMFASEGSESLPSCVVRLTSKSQSFAINICTKILLILIKYLFASCIYHNIAPRTGAVIIFYGST